MALVKKSPVQETENQAASGKTARLKNELAVFFLALSMTTLGSVFILLLPAPRLRTQPYPGPYNAPFRQFGIVSFVLVLAVGGLYLAPAALLRSFAGESAELVVAARLVRDYQRLDCIHARELPKHHA